MVTYLLRSKGVDLGKIEFDHEDWPWFSGRFVPFESFLGYADVFAQEERLFTNNSARQERDNLLRQIVLMELQLVHADSGILEGEPDVLYIRNGRVSWRGHSGALRSLYKD